MVVSLPANVMLVLSSASPLILSSAIVPTLRTLPSPRSKPSAVIVPVTSKPVAVLFALIAPV